MEGYLAVPNWITFLATLHNLEEVVVKDSSWEEIFPYEELFGQQKHARILPQLKELQLFDLPLFKHLWKEDTKPSPIFHNLENLSVTMSKIEKFSTPLSVFQKFDDSRYIEMSWID